MGGGFKLRQFGTLKQTTHELIERCGGPREAARHTRVSAAALFQYNDDEDERCRDRYVPVDVVQDLEAISDYPLVTEWLASRAGWLLLPSPAQEFLETHLQIDIVEVGEETAQLFRDWADFVGNDGVIDRAEAEALLRDNLKLLRVLLHMRKGLEDRIADTSVPAGSRTDVFRRVAARERQQPAGKEPAKRK